LVSVRSKEMWSGFRRNTGKKGKELTWVCYFYGRLIHRIRSSPTFPEKRAEKKPIRQIDRKIYVFGRKGKKRPSAQTGDSRHHKHTIPYLLVKKKGPAKNEHH